MSDEVDHGLYSRQIFSIGADAQKALLASRFLIIGMSGVGAELAKNIALAGAKGLDIADDNVATYMDLSTQFLLTEEDVAEKRNRAAASVANIRVLNPTVTVNVVEGVSTKMTDDAFIGGYQCVICANQLTTSAPIVDLAERCRRLGVKFLAAEARGLFTSVFVDNGPEHIVKDPTGEPPSKSLIVSFTNTCPVGCVLSEDSSTELSDGDVVRLSDVAGPLGAAVNGKYFAVTMKSRTSLTLHTGGAAAVMEAASSGSSSADDLLRAEMPPLADLDGTSLPAYSRGGLVTSIVMPKRLAFEGLRAQVSAPTLEMDLMDFEAPPALHALFRAFHSVASSRSDIPPHDASFATAIGDAAKGLCDDGASVPDSMLKTFSAGACGGTSAVTSFLGGLVAQEAAKAVTGKFTPIRQWMFHRFSRALPRRLPDAPSYPQWAPMVTLAPADDAFVESSAPGDEYKPLGGRYDGQIVLFGRTYQKLLGSRSVFVVGAGALGCEFLKIFALTGMGRLIVTDMDTIERTNLSRQFLFRNSHIGQPKSTVAGRAAQAFNPSIKVETFNTRVGPDTEGLFNDVFWNSLDIVVNALDNVQARQYVDSRCVTFGLPLLESGTEGTKANVQAVIPHLTESYSQTTSRDPPEKSAPICTLKVR